MSMGLGIPLLLFCGWLFAIFFYERPLVLPMDGGNEAQVADAFEALAKQWPRLDGLANLVG